MVSTPKDLSSVLAKLREHCAVSPKPVPAKPWAASPASTRQALAPGRVHRLRHAANAALGHGSDGASCGPTQRDAAPHSCHGDRVGQRWR